MNRPGLKAFGKFDLISIDNEKEKKKQKQKQKVRPQKHKLQTVNCSKTNTS